MGAEVRIDPTAVQRLAGLVSTQAMLGRVAKGVRDKARQNASVFAAADHVTAIESEQGRDEQGHYADVGYLKRHPGFFLWWWEVGTRNHPPRPHLRPALGAGRGLVEYTSASGRVSYISEKQAANYSRNRR